MNPETIEQAEVQQAAAKRNRVRNRSQHSRRSA